MRKLILTASAVAAAIAGAFAAETAFGTFTDARDGQKYKTVKIGKQTWMAQNLNYNAPNGSLSCGSRCNDNSLSYCEKYGRLYDWKTAATVCPNGWKLPSNEDWDKLETTAGGQKTAGKKLKSKSGWNNRDDGKSGNGTDDYSFSALPGGCRFPKGYLDVGNVGGWWAATDDDDNANTWIIYNFEDGMFSFNIYKSNRLSVRCVED
jgi:uncharacterized protein (TIGR02145 family)